MAKWPWRSRSPIYIFQGIVNALTWPNGFCGERGKSGDIVGTSKGPWQRIALIIYFEWIFVGGLSIQLFPLSASIISWPMRHTIYTLPYPLNKIPHVSPTRRGSSETQEFKCLYVFCSINSMFGTQGFVIYFWKRLENTFPMVYYTYQNF